MILGALLMIPCYLVLGFSSISPAFPMILLGAAFVLVPAAMWPAVPLIVEKNRVGTAFGLMTMIQNIGLAVVSRAERLAARVDEGLPGQHGDVLAPRLRGAGLRDPAPACGRARGRGAREVTVLR